MRLDAAAAAQAVAGIVPLDPRGIARAADLQQWAERGQCFAIQTQDAAVSYILHVENGQVWIQAAQASGPFKFSAVLDQVIEAQAAGHCHSIGFQTSRPGAVRMAKRLGYRVTGWIMKRELQQ